MDNNTAAFTYREYKPLNMEGVFSGFIRLVSSVTTSKARNNDAQINQLLSNTGVVEKIEQVKSDFQSNQSKYPALNEDEW
jgi:hypothetical protein